VKGQETYSGRSAVFWLSVTCAFLPHRRWNNSFCMFPPGCQKFMQIHQQNRKLVSCL